MSTTYTTYVAQLRTMIASQSPDTDFDTILPAIIDYAEQRIYRELDLLSTVVRDTSVQLTAGNRNAVAPSAFVVINGVNVFSPAASGTSGSRVPLVALSRDALDLVWPGNSTTSTPAYFAMVSQWTFIVGPSPDANYTLEIIGTQRPAPLSSGNPTTFLTLYLPDLFLAASMVFASGYMRNFGAMASDPQMGMSWETQYDALKNSAATEEARKHFWSTAWSSLSPAPLANPPRG